MGQPRGTSIALGQVRNYGVSISADGFTLALYQPWAHSDEKGIAAPYSITADHVANGAMELRYAGRLPQWNLHRMLASDLTIDRGPFGITVDGSFTDPALVTVLVINGQFTVVGTTARGACP